MIKWAGLAQSTSTAKDRVPKPAKKTRKRLVRAQTAPILAAPEAKPPLPRSKSKLEILDEQSAELQRKLEQLNDRKDAAHATKGWDSPVVKRLNKQVRMLNKRLCKISKQRYELRCQTPWLQRAATDPLIYLV